MGKGRKRKASESTWIKVDVGLGSDEQVVPFNHYDDDRNSGPVDADRDFDAKPGEDVGLFYGLEVLDSSKYEVKTGADGIKRISILSEEAANVKGQADEKEPPESNNKKQKKKKKQQQPKSSIVQKDLAVDTAVCNHDEALATDGMKTKPQQQTETEKASEQAVLSAQNDNTVAEERQHDPAALSMQSQWCIATGGVVLHLTLCQSLVASSFWAPTPIQSAALPAAMLGRRDIVGAAPTGSGKTLAFLIPICHSLLTLLDEKKADEAPGSVFRAHDIPLQALVLTPTRELALQVHKECLKLLQPSEWKATKFVGVLVGGLAHAKQARVLDKDRPPVLVGTVGRLWELLSSRNHRHLNDLSQLRFLVIDEADRMIQQGSFPQLGNILDCVQRANPMHGDSDDEDNAGEESDEIMQDRMLGLPGVRGEAKLQMLTDDILKKVEVQRCNERPEIQDLNDDEYRDLEADIYQAEDTDDELSLPILPPVHRQTFVYSATLTLPATTSLSKPGKRKLVDVDGAIAEILVKARAKGRHKIIDLTRNSDGSKDANTHSKSKVKKTEMKALDVKQGKVRLPPGLMLQEIKCTQLHKDSHLYAYLMTTDSGRAGPCLVFCNSIKGVRRVSETLRALGVNVLSLHAKMQQRARLKVMDSFKLSTGCMVVVATDVAARGLDLSSITTVVHYDAVRNIDTFVHRSGRTARGVGDGAVGRSLSLVASDEDKIHTFISKKLGATFQQVMLDGRLLRGAQERVNLASKVVAAEDKLRLAARQQAWFKEAAEEVEVELDEDLMADAQSQGIAHSALVEAEHARNRLRKLLQEPLVTQRYGKFLSTNTAARQGFTGSGVVLPSGALVKKSK